MFDVGRLPWPWVSRLIDYWAQYPPAGALRRLEMLRKSDWKPPREERPEGYSSTPEEIEEFASHIGVPVGGIEDMPPHLKNCLAIARQAIKTGKVN